MGRLKTLQFRMAFLIHPKVHKEGESAKRRNKAQTPPEATAL